MIDLFSPLCAGCSIHLGPITTPSPSIHIPYYERVSAGRKSKQMGSRRWVQSILFLVALDLDLRLKEGGRHQTVYYGVTVRGLIASYMDSVLTHGCLLTPGRRRPYSRRVCHRRKSLLRPQDEESSTAQDRCRACHSGESLLSSAAALQCTQTSHAGPNDDLQTRRGEAPGLPTYNEPGTTVPMPTLPYPEAAYRPDEAHPDSQQDPSLPGYEHNGPPKYDYGANQPPAVQQPSVPFYTTAEQQQQQQVQQQQQEMQQMGDQRVFTPATTPNIANQVPLYPVSEEPIGTLHTVSLDNPWQDRNRA